MAISTTLIGKLGGIETQETRIDDNTTTTIPAGWRKAAGVFRGQMVYGMSNGTVFGTSLRPIGSGDTVPVNGGGCSQQATKPVSATCRALLPGTGWSDPWGGDLGGGKLADHRNPRRRRGRENLRGANRLRQVGDAGGVGETLPRLQHLRVSLFAAKRASNTQERLPRRHCDRYRAGELAAGVVA